MKKLLTLFVLILCLLSLYESVPVRCAEGTINALSIDEETSTLGYVNCQNIQACVLNCRRFYRSCNKKVYFAHFTRGAHYFARRAISAAYNTRCINREGENLLWLKKFVSSSAVYAKRRMAKSRPKYNLLFRGTGVSKNYMSKNSYSKVIKKLLKTRNAAYVVIARLAQLLLTLDKICRKKPNWKKNLNYRLNNIFSIEFIKNNYKGNFFLRQLLIKKVRDANGAISYLLEKFRNSRSKKLAVRRMKSLLIQKFKQRVHSGKDDYLCKCHNFFADRRVKRFIPRAYHQARVKCKRTCFPYVYGSNWWRRR
eukprot:gene8065-12526_t